MLIGEHYTQFIIKLLHCGGFQLLIKEHYCLLLYVWASINKQFCESDLSSEFFLQKRVCVLQNKNYRDFYASYNKISSWFIIGIIQ